MCNPSLISELVRIWRSMVIIFSILSKESLKLVITTELPMHSLYIMLMLFSTFPPQKCSFHWLITKFVTALINHICGGDDSHPETVHHSQFSCQQHKHAPHLKSLDSISSVYAYASIMGDGANS